MKEKSHILSTKILKYTKSGKLTYWGECINFKMN